MRPIIRTFVFTFLLISNAYSDWKPLAEDGYHDPDNPAIGILQEPGVALSQLPKDPANVGNMVNWVDALRDGDISPRTNLYEETEVRISNLDIIFRNTGSAAYVLFPHRAHTEWLDCDNCHDELFERRTGATAGLSMMRILGGEFCGRCHGAVSFPLNSCNRCHSLIDKGDIDKKVKDGTLKMHQVANRKHQ